MRFGLALPHYDFSLSEGVVAWDSVRDWAVRAERYGFDSLWVSDHLFLDLARYGGPDRPQAAMECFTTLAALAAVTERVRLGTLVVCNDLRPPSLVAKMAATLDVLSGGRFETGLGAGWYEPEYRAAGIPFDPPGVRVSRLEESVQIVAGMLGEDAFTFEGTYYRIKEAWNLPQPIQKPRSPVWVGGKGDRITSIAGRLADGYNTVWSWRPEAYAGRVEVLESAARGAGRDPSTVRRSVGLYCLPGRDGDDLRRRWEAYVAASPQGVAPQGGLQEWREGKLCGTPDEMGETIAAFEALGVEEVILGFGLLPFQIADPGAVEVFVTEVMAVGP